LRHSDSLAGCSLSQCGLTSKDMGLGRDNQRPR
jgi:hypothetical protein